MCTLVFRIEPHEVHRVESVEDGAAANIAHFRKIEALAADRVVSLSALVPPMRAEPRVAGRLEVRRGE
jgi:hypothetical protein